MNRGEYRYLNSEQVQAIILASLSIRPMTEDELTDVVDWCDDAYRRWGILENVLEGRLGLEPLPLPDRGVITRVIDHEAAEAATQADGFVPSVSTEVS